MDDPEHEKGVEDWTAAACQLLTMDVAKPLEVHVTADATGRDMPDTDLDSLCDAIMDSVGRSAR